MSKETDGVVPVPMEFADNTGKTAAQARWMQDLGAGVELLAHMMRKPTDVRPFVYELRFNLVPAKNDLPVLVLKGFGETGGLCAFYNASGFLQMLRGASSQMEAGKLRWYEDQYVSNDYEKRVALYQAGAFYKV